MTSSSENFVTVARADQIPPGTLRVFRAGDRRIAVSHVEGKFYAMDDVCTHDGGPLGEGKLKDDEIECPRHGARFSVKTGAALSMPAVMAVRIYPVRLDGNEIMVQIDD